MSNKKIDYTDPVFEQLLRTVPVHLRKETERSYGIAERIDAILKQKGLSKTDLARLTGKKNAEVSKWLSGTQNFTLRTIALIEEALGCELISIAQTKPLPSQPGFPTSHPMLFSTTTLSLPCNQTLRYGTH